MHVIVTVMNIVYNREEDYINLCQCHENNGQTSKKKKNTCSGLMQKEKEGIKEEEIKNRKSYIYT